MNIFRFMHILSVLTFFSFNTIAAENLGKKEKERMNQNEQYDRYSLREKTTFVIDCSPEFIVESKDKQAFGEFTISKIPPTVKMMIPPDMKPEYLPDGFAYGDKEGWQEGAL